MIKLADLDKEENLVNLEKLAAMDIEIKISKSSEKALDKMIKAGVTDLNDFEIEDAEYEEIEIQEIKGDKAMSKVEKGYSEPCPATCRESSTKTEVPGMGKGNRENHLFRI